MDGSLPLARMVSAGQASGPSWSGPGQADQAADQPSGYPAMVTLTSTDSDINAAAVAAYRASLQVGKPLSERKLAEMFGKSSRRWARSRMAEARADPVQVRAPGSCGFV